MIAQLPDAERLYSTGINMAVEEADVREELGGEDSSEAVELSQDDASALMKILMERGYFHDGVEPPRSENIQFDTCDRKLNCNSEDSLLVETGRQPYITLDELAKQITAQLNEEGRWSIKKIQESTGVSHKIICSKIVPRLAALDSLFTVHYAPNGDPKEILTAGYLDEKTKTLWSTLLQSDESGTGTMAMQDAAESIFDLPIDVCLSVIEARTATSNGTDVWTVVKDNGFKVLVTQTYWTTLRDQVAAVFRSCSEPVETKAVAVGNGWDVSWVSKILFEEALDKELPGEWHGETYVPNEYTLGKRLSVVESFATNGHVTSHMCHTMFGILPSQMKEYLEDDEAALVLESSVVHRDTVLVPLIVALQEAIDSDGWLDLQIHLPVEMLEHETEDARALVDHSLGELAYSDGVVCVNSGGALFFTRSMISDFQADMPDLIKSFAKKRAQELFCSTAENESKSGHATSEDAHMTGKEKRKARKAKSKHAVQSALDTHPGIVPVDNILRDLQQKYPELAKMESSETVLSEICSLAFVSDNFAASCATAVHSELDRLQSERKAASRTVNQIMDAGEFHSVEAAFEDPGCFANACYMIQAQAKFLSYALDGADPLHDDTKAALKKEFLSGCCADFVARITQYALLKNEVEDGIFSFRAEENSESKFFNPIDLGQRTYETTHLSCTRGAEGKKRDPLKLLRELLPGSVGVFLARQWILCGGECYQGGTKQSSSGAADEYTRPGDLDAFLAHVQENCLSICGLPFTKLDKKSEKKFLTARRQRLAQLLENATDATTVLDLRIMLLYQLVKNMVVSGTLLRGPILRILSRERKVSETVADELSNIADRLGKGEHIDFAEIEQLKSGGLAKRKN